MLEVFAIHEGKDGNGKEHSRWTKIGVAFTNKDESINVLLDAVPLHGGRLQIRKRREREDKDRRQEA